MRRHRSGTALALSLTVLLAAACSSNKAGSGTTSPTGTSGGTASVACAGSLTKLYSNVLGPKFAKATGDHFGGPPCAGSSDLAQEIMSKAISPGAFLAVGAHPIESLFPSRAKFAINLATDPLVVAYSAKSKYASQLNAIAAGSKPLASLFSLMATPGFRLGRTDPTQDPQGEFFILMNLLAQSRLHLPVGQADKVLGIAANNPYGSKSQQFDEDALPVDEVEGEVDAGSSYLSEAKQYGLKYISLPADLNFSDPADLAIYSTVSIQVAGAPFTGKLITLDTTLVMPPSGTRANPADTKAADAFVAYLLSPPARSLLSSAGYTLEPPTIVLAKGVTSAKAALPSTVLSAFDTDRGTTAT